MIVMIWMILNIRIGMKNKLIRFFLKYLFGWAKLIDGLILIITFTLVHPRLSSYVALMISDYLHKRGDKLI